MAIFRRPDPLPLKGPSSASPKLKMVGNMIELKNPTARMLHIATRPLKSIEAVTNAPATIAQRPSKYRGLKRWRSPAPRKRPSMEPPQKNETKPAAVLAEKPAISGKPK